MRYIITTYPKILLFTGAILLSYMLYHVGAFHAITEHLDGYGYVTIFFAGLLYSLGFSAPFATAYFVEMAPHVSPVPAALLGGLGAATADMGIFTFVSVSLEEEIRRLRSTSIMQRIHDFLHHETLPERARRWLKWIFASAVIGSPLPDEIGLSLLAGITDLESRRISVLCFVLNTAGILFILLLAR